MRALYVFAIAVPIIELSHTIWLYLCGQTNIIKLLPFHLCASQSVFIPLAVFTKSTALKEYIFATSILGGFFGMTFPAGVAGNYPIFHYQTIQTMVLHSLLILIPLALIVCFGFRPDIRNFSKVLGIFFTAVIPAAAVDSVFGENYMFLRYPPEGTPLSFIFDHFGRGIYLLLTFLLFTWIVFCLYKIFPYNRNQKIFGAKNSVDHSVITHE